MGLSQEDKVVNYSLDIDIQEEISSFGIQNKMNDYIKVQKAVLPILESEKYFGCTTFA